MAVFSGKTWWVVTIDRPFYPSVYYFDTREEAEVFADSLVKEEDSSEGQHIVRVTVAQTVSTAVIHTYY